MRIIVRHGDLSKIGSLLFLEVIDIYMGERSDGMYYGKKGPGRPRKYNARIINFSIKLNGEEREMVRDLMEDMSLSASGVFRYLLHIHYDELYYGRNKAESGQNGL